MKFKWVGIVISICILGFFACAADEQAQDKAVKKGQEPPAVTLMTHDSFSVSKEVVKSFETLHNAKVVIIKSGDAGEALNKAILSKNNPLADVFYGVDNTFLTRALEEDLFIAYTPENLEDIAKELQLDPENRLVPVDFGDVCLNYDISWFKENNIQPPSGLEDLIKPEYKGLTVVQNPATSSPGLAFLLATISRFGQDGYLDFWRKLKANDLLVVNGWKEAYWGEFTAASKGERPIVVSYASSPPAEVFYSKSKPEQAPTAAVIENGSTFRQIEFAGILKNCKNPEMAKKLMDFLLSKEFQEDIPLQMFVFPSNTKAVLPGVFVKHAKITKTPGALPYELISEKRDAWIREWTEHVLQ